VQYIQDTTSTAVIAWESLGVVESSFLSAIDGLVRGKNSRKWVITAIEMQSKSADRYGQLRKGHPPHGLDTRRGPDRDVCQA
jgi:hypothetical protein